ncbi:MAG: [protein-PII] uridylyltransferase [Gammaproteobacteria bacterium]|nr:[protein-PII] uridylyltransferase [Gammaproteobacteria bacterium]
MAHLPPAGNQARDPLAEALAAARSALAEGIRACRPPARLLAGYSRAADTLLLTAWRDARIGQAAALFATGGYGRRELYPESDVDLAVILDAAPSSELESRLEGFVQRLWDLGFKAGIAVRTLEQTRAAAAGSAPTYTSLRDARLLAGPRRLARALDELLRGEYLWPAADYLAAKYAEQQNRHARYGDSTQRLEPSVKEGPGGLRDMATIGWIAARRLGLGRASLVEIERAGLLLSSERRALAHSARALARVRLCLHHLAGRNEERLLFDLQPRIAELLGYRARPGALAVECLMQDYYRAAATVARANRLLFAELEADPQAATRALGPDLVARGNVLDFSRPDELRERPELMFTLLERWQREPGLGDLAPGARRAVVAALPALDARTRNTPGVRSAFMRIMKAPRRVTEALIVMHETGLLNRYLPAFARISGRMQYDLFHVFTVDEHVLRVVANAEALCRGEFDAPREDLRAAAAQLDRPELLYLAALFHDIAKGRGGDHSALGAREARHFCRRHGLGKHDAELVAWLVAEHLALSITAQKTDLSDPRVIADFTRRVGDQRRLDYLYVLTVADVQATNPSLWNSWRAALFSELYQSASRALWRGLEDPMDPATDIAACKREARALLADVSRDIDALWSQLGEAYFLQYPPEEVAWHTRVLLAAAGPPAVFLRPAPEGIGTAVAIYSSRDVFVFARVTAVLAELGLTVLAARCVPVDENDTFDTYLVLEADASPIDDPRRLARVQALLAEALVSKSEAAARVSRPTPRQVRLFKTPTQIHFHEDPAARHSVLELRASDRPGLLAAVGRSLRRSNTYLRMARIMTAGERAEDVFHITNAAGKPLSSARLEELEAALREEIAAESGQEPGA